MSNLEPGAVVDQRFEVVDLVGQGGMGIVYRARQTNMNRDVALKMLKGALVGEPDKMKRFRREAQVISKLDHPNIVRVYAVGVAESQPYIAMEYLSGRQLSDIIHADGPLPWQQAIKLFMQMCDALEYAHSKEIIHRDVKPSNIIVVSENGSDARVKLVDFGIAKAIQADGPQLTQTEMVMGSVFYLSPGQFQGRSADVRSDMYSFGCTCFEVLAGEPPFRGDTVYDTIQGHANDPLPKVNAVNPQAQIPEDLQSLLVWMTQKDPATRPPSMAAVRAALSDISESRAVVFSDRIRQAPQPVLKKFNKKLLLVLTSFACCFIAGLGVYFSMHNGPPPKAEPVQQDAFILESNEERILADRINGLADIKVSQEMVAAYAELAKLYLDHDQPLRAAMILEQALWYTRHNLPPDPKSEAAMQANFNLGLAYQRLGREDDAILKYMDGLSISLKNGEFPTAWILKVIECYVRLGMFDKAMIVVEKLESRGFADEPISEMAWAAQLHLVKQQYQQALGPARGYLKGASMGGSSFAAVQAQTWILTARLGKHDEVTRKEIRALNNAALSFTDLAERVQLDIAQADMARLHSDTKFATALLQEAAQKAAQDTDPDLVDRLGRQKLCKQLITAVLENLALPFQKSLQPDMVVLDDKIASLQRQLNDRSGVRLPVPTPNVVH